MFASNRIANRCEKIVLDPIPNSQHRPIRINGHTVAHFAVPFHHRFNLKTANLKNNFSVDLDASIKDLPASPINYDVFVKRMKKSKRSLQNILACKLFFVDLAGKHSRWHRQKNELPQRIILVPLLFNIYTNDQPIHPNTRSFLYADNLFTASQEQSFAKVEQSLTDALDGLTNYFAGQIQQVSAGKSREDANQCFPS